MKKTIFIAVLVSVVFFAWANLSGAQQKSLKEYMIWLQQQIEKQQKEMMKKAKPAKKELKYKSWHNRYSVHDIMRPLIDRYYWSCSCTVDLGRRDITIYSFKDGVTVTVRDKDKHITSITVSSNRIKALAQKGIKVEGDPAQFHKVINGKIPRLAQKKGIKVDAGKNLLVPFVKYVIICYLEGRNPTIADMGEAAHVITDAVLDGEMEKFNKLVDYFIDDVLLKASQLSAAFPGQ